MEKLGDGKEVVGGSDRSKMVPLQFGIERVLHVVEKVNEELLLVVQFNKW